MKDVRHGRVASSPPPKPRRWKRSLRVQVLVSTLVVGLIPIVLLAVVAAFGFRGLASTADDSLETTRRSLIAESVTAELQQDAGGLGRAIDRFVVERVDDVVRWAGQPAIEDPAELADELAQQRAFVDLSFLTEPVDAPWWDETLTSGAAIGSPTIIEPEQTTAIPIAARVDGAGGEPIGVVVGHLPLAALHEIVDLAAADDQQLTVVTADGILVAETATAHDPGRVGGDTVAPEQLSDGVLAALGSGSGSVTERDHVFGFTTIDWAETAGAIGAVDARAPIGDSPWIVVAEEPTETAFAALDGLEQLGRDLGDMRAQLAIVTAIVLVVSFLACALAARLIARKVLSPVERLTQRAKALADEDITTTITTGSTTPSSVGASLEDHAIDVKAGNELDELASSFDSVHRTALQMAAEQARMRQMTADMFANLGRRNQSLVKRQLRFIEELERSEEDPDRLAALFKLDHLATRMRRNAESLLVIAGHGDNSRRSKPVRIELVTRAALGEVENFERVDSSAVEPAAIMGRAVAGLAHVLAELVENALSFSPPEAPVRVFGERGLTHYTVSVVDRGIGLSGSELAAINQRLELEPDSDLPSSKQLGLLVVAKLARRHGFRVRLLESAAGGIAAQVEIPNALVQPPEQGSDAPPQGADSAARVARRAAHAAKVQGTPLTPHQPVANDIAESGDTSGSPAAAGPATASATDPAAAPRPVAASDRAPVPRPVAASDRAPVPRPLAASDRAPVPRPPTTTADAIADTVADAIADAATSPVDPRPETIEAAPERRRSDERPAAARPTAPPTRQTYRGSLSAASGARVAAVPRRESRRPKPGQQSERPSDDRREGAPRSTKRAVAVATADHEVVEEATDVQNRWNRFRAGRMTAAERGPSDG